MSNSALTSRCHCGAFSWTFARDTSSPPQQHTFCHCSSCRHRYGSLSAFGFYLPKDIIPPLDQLEKLGKLTTTGDHGNQLSTYWCKKCGTNVLAKREEVVEWDVCPSTLDSVEGLFDLKGHEWLGRTGDGGMAAWIPSIKGQNMSLYGGDQVISPSTKMDRIPQLSEDQLRQSAEELYLRFHCYCKGFDIYVARPEDPGTRNLPYWLGPALPLVTHSNSDSTSSFSSPRDVIPSSSTDSHPDASDLSDSNHIQNANQTPHLPPPLRRRAKLCACSDCTLSSGTAFPAAAWIDIPFSSIYTSSNLESDTRWVDDANIAKMKGTDGELSSRATNARSRGVASKVDVTQLEIDGLTRHDSTKGKTARFFCEGCGAKVMLLSSDGVDVPRIAAGLLSTTFHPPASSHSTGPISYTSDSSSSKPTEFSTHGILAESHLAWWTGSNICRAVADLGLEDSADYDVGKAMAEGLASWAQERVARQKEREERVGGVGIGAVGGGRNEDSGTGMTRIQQRETDRRKVAAEELKRVLDEMEKADLE